MTTTDDVIGSIDHALRDYGISNDAMRWTPEPAPPRPVPSPLRFADVRITVDIAPFRAAMTQVAQAWREVFGKFVSAMLTFLNDPTAIDRQHRMHVAYRARARRRTRRNR